MSERIQPAIFCHLVSLPLPIEDVICACLHQSIHKIHFAQKCFSTNFKDPEAEATHLLAFPQSTFAFHWPRLDRDQLLCIREDIQCCSDIR